jgi:hypothetical protein
MTEKRITRIRTLDGFESEPFVSYIKTAEEEEEGGCIQVVDDILALKIKTD